jgi:hypothetical protein
MIKNKAILQEFEEEMIKKEKVDILKNFRLIEDIYKEAVFLGAFPPRNPLSGIEVDIKIAMAVNSVSKAPKNHRRESERY